MLSNTLRFAAVLPLVHVGICYWYLFCFYSAFGGGVIALLEVEDIFSVSLSDLASAYVFGIISIIAAYLLMFEKPLRFSDREEFSLHSSINTRPVDWAFRILFAISAIGIIVFTFLFDVFITAFALIIIATFLGDVARKISDRNSISNGPVLICAILIVAFTNITASAYKKGFALRHYPQAVLPTDRMQCEEWGLYRALGSYFVAVDEEGRRAIISQDCNVHFRLPERTITIDIV